MRPRLAVAAAVLAAFAVAASDAAAQGAPLTATGIRIADHPGTVRVVVDFTGGRVHAGQVIASDPRPFGDGRVRLPLIRRGVRRSRRRRAPRACRSPSSSAAAGS